MAEVLGAAGITAFATMAGEPLANFVLQQLKSKIEDTSLAETHKALNHGLQWLRALLTDKDNEVSSNIQKDTSNVYLFWTNRASEVRDEVTSLNKEYEGVRKMKLKFFESGDLKQKMKTALKEVIQILENCPKEIIVKLPERVIEEPGVPSIARYPTLQIAFQDILIHLQNKEVKCVALYGQQGVGKTTIMQHLNNHFYNSVDQLFDMVIFIKLPADERTEDLRILQKIADRIKMDRDQGDDECEVARQIQRVLVDKRYLLILDGVRRTPIGIWEKLDISNHKQKSKMVITTHYPLALRSRCVDRKVELRPLAYDEAWSMFQDIVGDKHLPDLTTASSVCRRFCCRLPLLINSIARSFKYQESPTNWQGALNECSSWPQVGVDDLVGFYSNLEICYRLLGDESKQKCFLYASLYPANSKIYTDYFVECCIAQGFLGDVDAATDYSGMRRKGIDLILGHLVTAGFLEEGEQMRYVKINDLYRKLAFHISSKFSNSECRMYVDHGEHEEAFGSTSWQHARWVSVIVSKRDSLPTNQNCGSLQTLLLQKNMMLVDIPSDYFDSMGNLLVLNLSETKIRNLPSLSGLTNLKAFYINGCSDLMIFPDQIQPLKHLEVFDVRDTRVKFVPPLNSLRCLRISYIESSDSLGISGLHKLEELTIEVKSLHQWCYDAENIISQVASLKNLTTFKCDFPFSETTLKIFLEASDAPIDWVRALIKRKPSPQVGVHGLSPAEAWNMFQDIVEAKQASP